MKIIKGKSSKSKTRLIICLLFISIIQLFYPRVCSTQRSVFQIHEEGVFFLSNTSDRYILFKETIYAHERHIGTTWNITLNISSNSSSGVIFSFESQANDWFAGNKEFKVSPNETRSEVYAAHCTSDETPGFNFLYSLVDIEKNASGAYKIDKIHPGYPLDEGSGDTCVWDISAWLERTISTLSSSTMSNQPVTSYGQTVILCLIALVCISLIPIKKHRKRKSN